MKTTRFPDESLQEIIGFHGNKRKQRRVSLKKMLERSFNILTIKGGFHQNLFRVVSTGKLKKWRGLLTRQGSGMTSTCISILLL